MSGPAKNGVIIYSSNIKRLSEFYIKMFGLVLQRETDDFISIGSDELNIVIHTPPIEIPKPNFNTVKLFITVDSHEKVRKRVAELGGSALEGVWSNPVFKAFNIADLEGNHIQIREFMP